MNGLEKVKDDIEKFAKPLDFFIKEKHYRGDKLVQLDFVLMNLDKLKKDLELKCPIPLCDFRPRSNKNDDPATAKTRLHGHLFLKHYKGELIHTIFILAGWEEMKDSDLWPSLKILERK